MEKQKQVSVEKKEEIEELAQLNKWKNFVNENLWPAAEDVLQESKKIWQEIQEKLDSNTLDKDTKKTIQDKISKEKQEFQKKLKEYRSALEKDYGPIIPIVAGIIYHDAPKIFDDVSDYLDQLPENLQIERSLEKMIENRGIDRQSFIKIVEGVVTDAREIYKKEKKLLDEAGVELDLASLMRVPFNLVFDRLPETERKKFSFFVSVDDEMKGKTIPYEEILREVLKELITNAVEVMKENGGTIHLRIAKNNNNIVLKLEDSGPGIPRENMDHVLEEGFTTKPGGTGQGLYLNKEAIEKIMNGSLAVESKVGRGTKFTITIPIPT
ncbi:ATP-binding protein [Patescibacteria group bacterium AH-259-L07]|nr:ATP-binding protein [Patescibacteria group bacterium AH-259-L07]